MTCQLGISSSFVVVEEAAVEVAVVAVEIMVVVAVEVAVVAVVAVEVAVGEVAGVVVVEVVAEVVVVEEVVMVAVLEGIVSGVRVDGVVVRGWPSWGETPSLKTIEEVLVDWSLFVLEGVRSDRLRSTSAGLTEPGAG